MVDMLDMLGPMMPRRPVGPGLPVPHPAAGVPPDIAQILAEAASQMAPSDSRVVNNPTTRNVDPQALHDALLLFATNHAGSGSFPGLTRALIDNLARAHMGALDTEAKLQPTIARMLMQRNSEPDMMSIMALDNPADPKLSSYYGANNPSENPDATIAASNEFSKRLQALQPQAQGANADAIAQDMASSNDLRPSDLPIVDRVTHDNLDQFYNLNNNLRMLALAQQRGGAAGAQTLNGVIGHFAQNYPERAFQALQDAINQSGIGLGRHVPTLDPASMRSLAPDINPAALGYNIASDSRAAGNDSPDLELLMSLMGLNRTGRKSGV